jgi:hypothetical protein
VELSNKVDDLIFNKHDEYERGKIQGSAQTLHNVIHLPQELKELKSMKEIEEKRRREMYPEPSDYSDEV